MNYLYELGAAKQAIIRPYTDRVLNGVNYVAGEPYTVLKDVDITLVYSSVVSENTTASTKPISRRQNWSSVTTVVMNNVPLTSKILALTATRLENEAHTVTKHFTAVSDDGKTLYLNDAPVADSLFVYDSGGTRVAAEANGIVATGDFAKGESYLVFYKVATGLDVYSLDVPQYGYFTLEAIGVGNKDKSSKPFYLNFPTLSLLPQPQAMVGDTSIVNCVLEFSVAETKTGGRPTIAV